MDVDRFLAIFGITKAMATTIVKFFRRKWKTSKGTTGIPQSNFRMGSQIHARSETVGFRKEKEDPSRTRQRFFGKHFTLPLTFTCSVLYMFRFGIVPGKTNDPST